MDNDFILFIAAYNSHMRSLNANEYVYTEEQLKSKIDTNCPNRKNMYDKVAKYFPTIQKFMLDNYHKVYIDSRQKLVLRTKTCHVCNNNFGQVCAVKLDEDREMIHATCDKKRKNEMKCRKVNEMFNDFGSCFICSEEFTDNKNVLFTDKKFCHISCYVNKVKDRVKDNKCSICDSTLFTDLNKTELVFCYERKQPNLHFHSSCARGKHIQTSIRLSFNKCGTCRFYIEEKKYIHDFCS